MNMKLAVLLVGFLLSAAAAESIRETELMDPNVIIEELIEASGSDDEDLYTEYYEEEDSNPFDESSGSGDSDEEFEDDLESTMNTPTTAFDNRIEEDMHKKKNKDQVDQHDNDILISRNLMPDGHEPSNEISMASTAHGFFSRTEVVIAVVAGGCVGLVFAIIIVLLVMRIRKNKKGELAYDPVKKPIYKKAPTIEA